MNEMAQFESNLQENHCVFLNFEINVLGTLMALLPQKNKVVAPLEHRQLTQQ